jgi:hypothetical protein
MQLYPFLEMIVALFFTAVCIERGLKAMASLGIVLCSAGTALWEN